MRISDWSSYVCSSDLQREGPVAITPSGAGGEIQRMTGRIRKEGRPIRRAVPDNLLVIGNPAAVVEDRRDGNRAPGRWHRRQVEKERGRKKKRKRREKK